MDWWEWVGVVLLGWFLLSLVCGLIWCAMAEVRHRQRARADRRGSVR